jgi:hypothetical protein
MDENAKAILIAAIVEMKQLVDEHWDKGNNLYADSQYEELRRLGEKLRKEIDGNSTTNRD